jgi:hypothetical protein
VGRASVTGYVGSAAGSRPTARSVADLGTALGTGIVGAGALTIRFLGIDAAMVDNAYQAHRPIVDWHRTAAFARATTQPETATASVVHP